MLMPAPKEGPLSRLGRFAPAAGFLAFLLGVGRAVPAAAAPVLSFAGAIADGAELDGLRDALGVTISPDGRHVYATAVEGNVWLQAFSRDGATGRLTFVSRTALPAGGIARTLPLAVSPDGQHVYAGLGLLDPFTQAVAGGIQVFARDPGTGNLQAVSSVSTHAVTALAFSPDGGHLYATGISASGFGPVSSGIRIFARSAATGALGLVGAVTDDAGGVDGLAEASGVTVSPDGAYVYATGWADNAVVTFARNPSTGALSFVELERDGVGGADGLAGAAAVVVSADGAHAYVAAAAENAVSVFSRDG